MKEKTQKRIVNWLILIGIIGFWVGVIYLIKHLLN